MSADSKRNLNLQRWKIIKCLNLISFSYSCTKILNPDFKKGQGTVLAEQAVVGFLSWSCENAITGVSD